MAQQTGATARIIYATETVYKTTPGTPDAMVLPIVSESLRIDRALTSSRTIRSSRQPQMPVRGRMNVSGDINFELAPECGRLMKHVFGSQVKTGASAPYTYAHKIAALPAGMCLEKQFPDLDTPQYFLYNGCKVNSFKCSGKAEGFIDCTVALIGGKETIGTASFDSTPTDLGHTPFDGFEAAITQGGAPLTEVITEYTFQIENELDDSIYAVGGAGQRSALREGIAKVSGQLTAFFANVTLYNLAVNNTETSLQIDFTHGTGTGATAGNEKMTFKFDELKFSPRSPAISGPTGLLVELPFEAYYRADADASAAQMILLTSVANF